MLRCCHRGIRPADQDAELLQRPHCGAGSPVVVVRNFSQSTASGSLCPTMTGAQLDRTAGHGHLARPELWPLAMGIHSPTVVSEWLAWALFQHGGLSSQTLYTAAGLPRHEGRCARCLGAEPTTGAAGPTIFSCQDGAQGLLGVKAWEAGTQPRPLAGWSVCHWHMQMCSPLWAKATPVHSGERTSLLSTSRWCPALCAPSTAARQAPLFSTVSWSSLKFTSIESVMLTKRIVFSINDDS